MIGHDLNVGSLRLKHRGKNRAFDQSKWMIGDDHYRPLLGNQRQVALRDLRMDVQELERTLGNGRGTGAGSVSVQPVKAVHQKQFFDGPFHGRGQLVAQHGDKNVPHLKTYQHQNVKL